MGGTVDFAAIRAKEAMRKAIIAVLRHLPFPFHPPQHNNGVGWLLVPVIEKEWKTGLNTSDYQTVKGGGGFDLIEQTNDETRKICSGVEQIRRFFSPDDRERASDGPA
jgi:hypothetical protein